MEFLFKLFDVNPLSVKSNFRCKTSFLSCGFHSTVEDKDTERSCSITKACHALVANKPV